MKKERIRNIVLYAAICIASIIIMMPSGCLSEPMNKVGDIFYPSSINLFQNENYYEINPDELTVPVVPEQLKSPYEKRPSELSDSLPGFEISSYYYYTQFYEGSESIISVYVKNTGDSPVFIYKFGFLLMQENELVTRDIGLTVNPGDEKKIGIISLRVAQGVEELKLQPQVSLLAQTKSEKWHDYRTQHFEVISIDVSGMESMQNPTYRYNPENIFIQMNSKIDPFDLELRKMAAESAKRYPGEYNIYQVCSLFDDTKEKIQYISDPRGKDLWSPPGDTLAVGAGDCDDYAILLASLIESIGGTSRIYLTDTHAFAAVYIGNNTEEIANAIGDYYGSVPIYYTTDEYGCWLMMDPTSSIYPGGLPGGTAPTDDTWTFLDTNTVIVIDIAPQM
ncbi:transglutaminase family protein [Methanolobus sp. WCC5]|uniref:transglutaminase-like domain-containing protein n=1 Tax=Methanolobus sp. WCC5 TaxID=3125785 RepID=UPI00324EB014